MEKTVEIEKTIVVVMTTTMVFSPKLRQAQL